MPERPTLYKQFDDNSSYEYQKDAKRPAIPQQRKETTVPSLRK
jgi:hypothetical protein